ncbi:hypothetical protein TanjilG_07582 [Lupinus angustifolius]|uniref:UBP-type domain-containing protein n=1 Tax=Lupinus angustifolius TaxID=3871 RepID=A0A1J7FX69_LUPAN|nr:hypothetical protein TanjilG_07582 [Lupinus angustifolius]
MGSSSSAAAGEEDMMYLDLMDGSESGWVSPKTSCIHLSSSLSSDLTHIPPPSTPCNRCQHPSENWLCLSCKEVLCSRFVNKHMLHHFENDHIHCVALSFSDLSVWCFSCNAYLDPQLIPLLRPLYQLAYLLKFAQDPPLPQSTLL